MTTVTAVKATVTAAVTATAAMTVAIMGVGVGSWRSGGGTMPGGVGTILMND